MSPGTRQTEKVYADIKMTLLSGHFSSAADISITMLAANMGISASPVRDALHRLYGERLLQPGDHHGFRVNVWTTEALRDCYTWHGRLIRLALKGLGAKRLAQPVAPEGWGTDYSAPERIVATAERMFLTLTEKSGSSELVSAVGNAGERLRLVRLGEIERWPDCSDELVAANILARSGTGNALLAALWNYHRRRIRAVSMLANAANVALNH